MMTSHHWPMTLVPAPSYLKKAENNASQLGGGTINDGAPLLYRKRNFSGSFFWCGFLFFLTPIFSVLFLWKLTPLRLFIGQVGSWVAGWRQLSCNANARNVWRPWNVRICLLSTSKTSGCPPNFILSPGQGARSRSRTAHYAQGQSAFPGWYMVHAVLRVPNTRMIPVTWADKFES